MKSDVLEKDPMAAYKASDIKLTGDPELDADTICAMFLPVRSLVLEAIYESAADGGESMPGRALRSLFRANCFGARFYNTAWHIKNAGALWLSRNTD